MTLDHLAPTVTTMSTPPVPVDQTCGASTADSRVTTLTQQGLTTLPAPAEVMTVVVDLPPGSPGAPPHRHSGPVFGYMLDGEMVFELEGEAPRVIRPGEAFSEPGGDVIHYQAANHLADRSSSFLAVMVGVPGEPMLTVVGAAELAQRAHLRHPVVG
jgi:quercetin dioxygenase-like cupin family protein